MLVSATLEVYKQTMANLLPTPAKSHYVFNLRDFARVVLGCLLIKPQSVENKKTFVRLWVHEVCGLAVCVCVCVCVCACVCVCVCMYISDGRGGGACKLIDDQYRELHVHTCICSA